MDLLTCIPNFFKSMVVTSILALTLAISVCMVSFNLVSKIKLRKTTDSLSVKSSMNVGKDENLIDTTEINTAGDNTSQEDGLNWEVREIEPEVIPMIHGPALPEGLRNEVNDVGNEEEDVSILELSNEEILDILQDLVESEQRTNRRTMHFGSRRRRNHRRNQRRNRRRNFARMFSVEDPMDNIREDARNIRENNRRWALRNRQRNQRARLRAIYENSDIFEDDIIDIYNLNRGRNSNRNMQRINLVDESEIERLHINLSDQEDIGELFYLLGSDISEEDVGSVLYNNLEQVESAENLQIALERLLLDHIERTNEQHDNQHTNNPQ